MVYYPYVPITWVYRFIEGIKQNLNQIITSKTVKEYEIFRPAVLIKSLVCIHIIDEQGHLTELGKKFIDFRTRKEACREILEKPPYDELVYRLRQGNFNSIKSLKEYIKGITGFAVDPVDKASALLIFFLKIAEYEELKDSPILKKAQTIPKSGTRKGKKNKRKINLTAEEITKN